MYWLLDSKSQLSIENKLLFYKAILKPIWTYGVQLWGTASNSNTEILQRFQNRYLRIIVSALWYITDDTLYHDLNTLETRLKDSARDTPMEEHPNILATNFMKEVETTRRLKRKLPQDFYIPDHTVIYRAYATGYMLLKASTNCQM